MKASQPSRLARLGVYGFDAVEPVILAALVTEDPLLLIGPSGTGKTYLLNSLSEALGLAHRHYNASLISFDDLVGFPYPEPDGDGVRFLETPATVWGAESVLIDEISRCKPEHQNRLFSLVHERRVQGIPLPKLRWRWAAMNPCSADQSGTQDYIGSEPLDPALADRFALFVTAPDWDELTEDERRSVVDPAGEGMVADDGGALRREIDAWRAAFEAKLASCPEPVWRYAMAATSALNAGKVRISPRRARLLARSLLAATIVAGRTKERLFRRVLEASLPHPCWGEHPAKEAIAAAHRAAWDSAAGSSDAWVHAFITEGRLDRKLKLLLDYAATPDAGSQAIAQCLAAETKERAAAFAFAIYPAAALGQLAHRRRGRQRPRQGGLADPVGRRRGELAGAARRRGHAASGLRAHRQGAGQARGRAPRARRAVLLLVRARRHSSCAAGRARRAGAGVRRAAAGEGARMNLDRPHAGDLGQRSTSSPTPAAR